MANAVPEENPTINRATINYSYTPVEGGIPAAFQVESNEVPVLISGALADLSVVKTASESTAGQGAQLTYTITVSNAGPSPAEDVLLTDAVPPSLTDAEYSVNGGTVFSPWSGRLSLGTLEAGENRIILIRGIVSPQAAGTIVNTAVVTSSPLRQRKKRQNS